MKEFEFLDLLRKSTIKCYEFAKNYVADDLPESFTYCVSLNVSCDDPHLKGFDIYPEDNNRKLEMLKDTDVAELLYRKGKIPVWIDISVECIHMNKTIIQLLCAGRYSDNSEDYYYNHHDIVSPFGIKGPSLPFGHKEGEKIRLKNRYKKSFLNRLKAAFNW
ncbi:hypothetical protein [uncultured Chryseobacterium sp.]|uniref:hypothetical protein n=1 Tax=uncultured Chryseobacterium sp. TaxID=259322 RepID=UPI002600EBE1|nr:hypothetical protein [uncultured Chryseobacterium sp.]